MLTGLAKGFAMMVNLNDAYLSASAENDTLQRAEFLKRMQKDIASGRVTARGLPWRARSDSGLRLIGHEPQDIPPAAMLANIMDFCTISEPDDVRKMLLYLNHPKLMAQSGEVVGVIFPTTWPAHRIPVDPAPAPALPPTRLRDRMEARRSLQPQWRTELEEIDGWAFVEVDIRNQSVARAAPPSDDSVLQFLREEQGKNGGFISQKLGGEIARQKFPALTRDKARALVKLLTGNEKRGPRGPRNKSAK